MSGSALCFDEFRLDPEDRRLTRRGAAVELNARYLDVLILLVEARGELVTKQRFMDEVWRGVPVTDEALTQAIRTLRRALDDDAAAPRFIATVPKHGYRFVAPVSAQPMQAGPPGESRDPAPPRPSLARAVIAGSAGAALAGAVVGAAYGLIGAASARGGGGAISGVLVLALVATLSAAVAGGGIAAGIGLGRRFGPRSRLAASIDGELGGLATGLVAHLVGKDAFGLLLGRDIGGFAGAIEGVIVGGAVGLALTEARRWLLRAAMLGALAGLSIGLIDGRLMAGSLESLVLAFPGSRFGFDALGALFGEDGLGPVSRIVTATVEGALFVAAMAWGWRRLAEPGYSPATPSRRRSSALMSSP
ncbi:winged helix-turn-helix domain-containing protein [Sphingomonas baiyangensis]|uniref:Transcriptional regulator n=1 Tax=Sphingomonas baiyangensis TaxID=2572576 RepID=A0A4V5PYI1_9SPHN|nr:transcriptional regulator [Sphingomonas baiyangensis]TKD51168.1 transcriptional regulator [Sphingomonas baiyangensis]